ncbi:MAG: GspH/FimT family pseudopilin [Janthinobacterium lividum]
MRLRYPHAVACSRQHAVSLFELMIVVALCAALGVAALPALCRQLAGVRVDSATRSLLAYLEMARAESSRRQKTVGVCRSDASGRCAAGVLRCGAIVSSVGDWNCGWSLVIGTGTRGANVLRRHPPVSSVAIAFALAEVRFAPPLGQFANRRGSISVSALSNRQSMPQVARCIRLNQVGRPKVDRGQCR